MAYLVMYQPQKEQSLHCQNILSPIDAILAKAKLHDFLAKLEVWLTPMGWLSASYELSLMRIPGEIAFSTLR